MTGWWPSALIAPAAVAVFLLAPQIRDALGTLLVASDAEYAMVPHSVLVERLRTAEAELLRTRYQAVLYQSLLDEYATLRAEVGARSSEAYMTARVLARPPRTHFDVLLIAAGTDQDVRVGDQVMVERILLGTVTDVSSRTAVVTLLSNPGTTHDVEVGASSAIVVLRGVGGGAFESEVPRSVALGVGDPAADPRGLVVALVGGVSYEPTDIAQTVWLASPVSFSDLREVSLIHP